MDDDSLGDLAVGTRLAQSIRKPHQTAEIFQSIAVAVMLAP